MMPNHLPPGNSLVGFAKVCQYLNISRASVDLSLSQAAVSRQISSLERLLDVALFNRRVDGVALTPEGERFANTVLPAIAAIKQAMDEAVSPLSPLDHLNLFAKGCISAQWLTPNIYQFRDAHPQAKIRIFSSTNAMDAKSNLIDIGIQYGPMNQRGFENTGRWKDEVIVVCSPEMKRCIPDDMSIVDIPHYPLIHLDGNRAIWSWEQYLENFGINRSVGEINLCFNNYQNAIDSAFRGKGLLLATRFLIYSAFQEGKLVQVGDYSIPSSKDLYLYIRPSTCTSKLARDFIDWIQTEFNTMLYAPTLLLHGQPPHD
jgi:LysR family glycine cleavage system transcriptional activator